MGTKWVGGAEQPWVPAPVLFFFKLTLYAGVWWEQNPSVTLSTDLSPHQQASARKKQELGWEDLTQALEWCGVCMHGSELAVRG